MPMPLLNDQIFSSNIVSDEFVSSFSHPAPLSEFSSKILYEERLII